MAAFPRWLLHNRVVASLAVPEYPVFLVLQGVAPTRPPAAPRLGNLRFVFWSDIDQGICFFVLAVG